MFVHFMLQLDKDRNKPHDRHVEQLCVCLDRHIRITLLMTKQLTLLFMQLERPRFISNPPEIIFLEIYVED